MVAKIRKSDMVKVLVGKDKGKIGVVLSVVSSGKAVLVEGLNMVKRSVRRNPQANEEGGYKTKEMPIDDMKSFMLETFLSMKNSISKAIGDKNLVNLVDDFCIEFEKRISRSA